MCQDTLPFEINKNICGPLGDNGTKVPKASQEEIWTTQCVIDELHCYLERLRDKDNNKKYEEQARRLIYKIPIHRPAPTFIVNKTDLCTRLIIELLAYPEEARNEILKSAVGRIFENIDERYYIQSVKRLLSVELCE
ncbi:hypothetical protein BH18THE2_BH18THE2_35780 [soil metagenome]